MQLQSHKRGRAASRWMLVAWVMFSSFSAVAAWAGETQFSHPPVTDGYMARQDSLRAFFQAVAAHQGMPIIVSKGAAQRQVSGNFDFNQRDLVGKLCRQLGLIHYNDGHAIYVYDASETRNGMMMLKNIRVGDVQRFLRKSGLLDPRFPLRGDGEFTFYIAGPPIYVDTVLRTAESMDSRQHVQNDQRDQRVEVIRLNNTFVSDRRFTRRDQDVVIPGMAAIVERLLADNGRRITSVRKKQIVPGAQNLFTDEVSASAEASNAVNASNATNVSTNTTHATGRAGMLGMPLATLMQTSQRRPTVGELSATDERSPTVEEEAVRVIAYPETNSLLVKGTSEQISLVRSMVSALDEEKRHVELALWIIDVEKEDLEQLGVKWRGQLSMAGIGASLNAGASLNTFSAIEGDRFTAAILALTRDSRANIVSRPVVLTQENVPATFDNNQTFYTPLIAERAVDLQHVTYGTLVQVLPRFTAKDEIELSLNIEDGGQVRHAGDVPGKLPVVSRTTISTVARVPKGKSLLIGGYTRGESGEREEKIPLLGDLPLIGGLFRYREALSKNAVRVFLIRPREITEGIDLTAPPLEDAVDAQSLIGEMADGRHVGKARGAAVNTPAYDDDEGDIDDESGFDVDGEDGDYEH